MHWPRFRAFMLPREAERDESFSQEIVRLSCAGLRIVSVTIISGGLFIYAMRFWIDHAPQEDFPRLIVCSLLVLVGLLGMGLSFVRALVPYARWLGLLMIFLVGLVSCWGSLTYFPHSQAIEHSIPGQIPILLMVAVAALPVLPWHTLMLGLSLSAMYRVMAAAAGVSAPGSEFVFLTLAIAVAVAMTAVGYLQRFRAYQSMVTTVQACDDLREYQQRMALSENASSMMRLAAALSHELNSPVGTLTSAIDTMLLLAARQATMESPKDQARLVKLQNDLRRSIQQSTQRLQQIAGRLSRFTNLDHAERQAVNLNELVRDVSMLVEPQLKLKPAAELKLDFAEMLPSVVCNPQQMSAVFFDLVSNAVGSLNGRGFVSVKTRATDEDVVVEIRDNGRGIPEEALREIFDPTFRETSGRVAAANWSMFNARQIVRGHLGEIRVESKLGEGSRVVVTLPSGTIV